MLGFVVAIMGEGSLSLDCSVSCLDAAILCVFRCNRAQV